MAMTNRAKIWKHQSFVGLYFVTDADGYIVASGLTLVEARGVASTVSIEMKKRDILCPTGV